VEEGRKEGEGRKAKEGRKGGRNLIPPGCR
jgi:hypothetical protein